MAISEKELRRNLPAWYVPVTEELLREITQRIVKACAPEKVLLFETVARLLKNSFARSFRMQEVECGCPGL